MQVLRQTMLGLAMALVSVTLLWLTWLTGQAEDQFAFDGSVAAGCEIPSGWSNVLINDDDDLAARLDASEFNLEEILTANCMPPDGNIPVGERLFLPPEIASQISPDCGPPAGWVLTPTIEGESLVSLANEYGIDLELLRTANCFIADSDFEPGMRIYVPFSAQSTRSISSGSATESTETPGSENDTSGTSEP